MQVSSHLLRMQVIVNCTAFQTSRHEGFCMAEQRLLILNAVPMAMTACVQGSEEIRSHY